MDLARTADRVAGTERVDFASKDQNGRVLVGAELLVASPLVEYCTRSRKDFLARMGSRIHDSTFGLERVEYLLQ